jgi:single-strand DNA-binding protein
VVWGRSAETINQYIKKGNPLFIEGRLKTQNWEGPDGVKRQRTEIIVESFQFIGGGQGGGNYNPSQNTATAQNTAPSNSPSNFGSTTPPPVNNQSMPIDNMPADANFGANNSPVMPAENPFADDGANKQNTNPDDISIDDIPF